MVDITTIPDAIALASVMKHVSYANFAGKTDFLAAMRYWDPSAEVLSASVPPARNDLVSVLWGSFKGCVVAWIGGVRTRDMLTRLIANWWTRDTDEGDWCFEVTRQALVLLQNAQKYCTTPTPLVLVGHSLGGDTAFRLASMVRQYDLAPEQVSVLTFGSPRPGGKTAYRLLDDVTMVRYCNVDDAAPLFPANAEDSVSLALSQGLIPALFSDQYRHPCGGRILYPQGGFYAANVPPASQFGFTPVAGASMVSSVFADGAHTMGAYLTRLALTDRDFANGGGSFGEPGLVLISAVTPPPLVFDFTRDRETLEVLDSHSTLDLAELRAEQIRVINSRTSQRGKNMPIVLGRPCKAVVSKDTDGTWLVSWVGQVIYRGPAKSRVSSVARHVNRFLRSMLSDGGVAGLNGFSLATPTALQLMASASGNCIPLLPLN